MRTISRTIIRPLASLFLICGLCTQSAHASTILLSGDSNITDILVGGQGLPIDRGNQQFFVNILQGGSSVVALENGGGIDAAHNVNSFYNSLSGVSSTIIAGAVTETKLAGAKLFISAVPDDPFTPSEIGALENLLAGGGSVFFLGESAVGGWPSRNGYINDALFALGSEMSILPNSTIAVSETATGSQIATNPLTAGVSTFTYVVPSAVDGGTTLFFGPQMQPFVAYEGTVIPIPPTIWLFGSSVLGLIGIARLGLTGIRSARTRTAQ